MFKRLYSPINTLVLLALSLGIVLLSSSISFPQDTYLVPQTAGVTLAWDPNDPPPEGYRIYQRTEGQPFNYSQPSWTGPDTSGTAYNLEWDTTYYFIVRAYVGALESADSEEVSFVAPLPEATTYSISVLAGDHGSISPGSAVTLDEGSGQVFAISPAAGYHIADVIVDGLSKGAISSYAFSQVSANHTIEAIFAIDTHQITASAGANGNISSLGTIDVDHGASKSYTMIPAIGHHVADVLVDGVSMGAVPAYTFSQIQADHTIHATFAVDTFAITAAAGADGTITPAGVVNVTYGGSQTFTFAANSGFRIADVQVDGQSMGPIGSHTFSNVTSAHTIAVSCSESVLVSIQIEAEDGDLVWPMEIGDDVTAAAGGFIWVLAGDGIIDNSSEIAGHAEYHFEAPETGDYVIWGRQISNDTTSDSFFISVDGQTEMVWHTKLGDQDVWTWDVVTSRAVDDPRDTTKPQKYRLEAGDHTLAIKQREDGTRLDTIVITNDLSLGISDLDSMFQAPAIEVNNYDSCISEVGTATISLNATDPGNGNMTYVWELPDGGSISGSGNRVEFSPESIGPHPCPYRVNVIVSSDASQLSSTYVFNIYVKLRGDTNGDGRVEYADLSQLRTDFGKTGDPGWIPADMNSDGFVNFGDLAILRRQFGQNACECP